MAKRKRINSMPTSSSKKLRKSSIRNVIRNEAKKVLLGISETKSYLRNNWSLLPIDGFLGVYNLCYAITQGDDAEQYLGKRIWIKDMSFRIACSTFTTNLSSKRARVVVFMSKKQITNSSTASANIDDLFRNTVVGDSTNYMVDLSKVSLLYDQIVDLPINTEGGSHTKTYKNLVFKIKFDREFTFDGNNSGIFKDKQIYLGVTGFDGNTTLAPCVFDLYYTVNFKDV